ncbi:dermonecrotic toxin LspiSicTox-betaIE1ii-like [Lineus longissimus]|uniref:dermonecrotic toxin LspiSicTox-betaIE1ii-like n=1 Tax=Lineus longissimus TaxID=88925 RepID=UPI002B4C7D29
MVFQPRFAVFFVALLAYNASARKVRPLFILKHLSNSREHVEKALKNGANGIEVDLRFKNSGKPSHFFHGTNCNCGIDKQCWCKSPYECEQRENSVPTFLQYFRNISTPGSIYYHPSFTGFVWLDLKILSTKQNYLRNGGIGLADILVDDVFNKDDKGSRAVFGLELYFMKRTYFMKALVDQLRKRNREDIIKNHIIAIVTVDFLEEYLREYKDSTPAVWLSDGNNDCEAHDVSESKARRMVGYRENANTVAVKKATEWVLDSKRRIREGLRYDVDLIMTNFPARVVEVLKEPEFYPLYRLATYLDSPNERI